jgi:hypothetical protein
VLDLVAATAFARGGRREIEEAPDATADAILK